MRPNTFGRRAKLSRIIGTRIVAFAVLAMLFQSVVVIVHYYADNTQLADLMIEHESGALAQGLRVQAGLLTFALPHGLQRYTSSDHGYFTRIRTPDGKVLYSDCENGCGSHLLPQGVSPPDSWSRLLRPGKPIAVEGGRSFDIDGQRAFIELAVMDDHERIMRRVLAAELVDDLAAPMGLMLVFALGGMLISVRFALRPVERAADEAEHIDPLDPSHTIDLSGMPREIADLGAAVNRMLARTSSLMQSQRVYTTAIAHEIRTPLAMMKLELGHIEHPRARKMEGDLDTLAHFVTQITNLGRLESANRAGFKTIDLVSLARGVVGDIAPWVYDHDDSIAFDEVAPGVVAGHASLIEDAVRNLIENSVRHTPKGTAILVSVGPGACIAVTDNAGLSGGVGRTSLTDHHPDGVGIGLQIIKRIMMLHHGELRRSVDIGRSTTMQLMFPQDLLGPPEKTISTSPTIDVQGNSQDPKRLLPAEAAAT